MRLIIFDADGTLINSQAIILEGLKQTFTEFGCCVPDDESMLMTVGLTLDVLFARLLDRPVDEKIRLMCSFYRNKHVELLKQPELNSQLYAGIDEVLDALSALPDTLLAIATGKSRRGLERMIDTFGYRDMFVALRTADDCPSKPHPAMILECCDVAGCSTSDSVMVGDSSYDMQMAVQAGSKALGVSWGYQSANLLVNAGAEAVVNRPRDIPDAIDQILGRVQS